MGEQKTLWICECELVQPVAATPLDHTVEFWNLAAGRKGTTSVWFSTALGGAGRLFSLGLTAWETEEAALEAQYQRLQRDLEGKASTVQRVADQLAYVRRKGKEEAS